jgi:hypothetical protein
MGTFAETAIVTCRLLFAAKETNFRFPFAENKRKFVVSCFPFAAYKRKLPFSVNSIFRI